MISRIRIKLSKIKRVNLRKSLANYIGKVCNVWQQCGGWLLNDSDLENTGLRENQKKKKKTAL